MYEHLVRPLLLSACLMLAGGGLFPPRAYAEKRVPLPSDLTMKPEDARALIHALRKQSTFEFFDADSDGQISPAEWHDHNWNRMLPFDSNADGALSQSEYLTMMLPIQALGGLVPKAAIKRHKGQFARYDVNSDGALTSTEFEKETASTFKRLDSCKDGAIRPDEFGDGSKREAAKQNCPRAAPAP